MGNSGQKLIGTPPPRLKPMNLEQSTSSDRVEAAGAPISAVDGPAHHGGGATTWKTDHVAPEGEPPPLLQEDTRPDASPSSRTSESEDAVTVILCDEAESESSAEESVEGPVVEEADLAAGRSAGSSGTSREGVSRALRTLLVLIEVTLRKLQRKTRRAFARGATLCRKGFVRLQCWWDSSARNKKSL